MKRITKLCRAFAFALFAWIVALQLPVSHTMLLLLVSFWPCDPATLIQLSISALHIADNRIFDLQGPLLLLVAFGLYLLMLLVAGAVSFRSCPEDAKALQEVSAWPTERLTDSVTLACCTGLCTYHTDQTALLLTMHRTYVVPGRT